MNGNGTEIIFPLIVSMAACLGTTVFRKVFLENSRGTSAGIMVYNAMGGAAAAAVLLAWGGFGECSHFTLLTGILFGVITGAQWITNLMALRCGPLAYTTLIVSFSTLISALSGVMFFGEDSLAVAQIIGIVLMLISFVFANGKDSDGKRANAAWLILCVIAFFFTGAIGIMQKVHQASEYKGEINAFLIIAFVTLTVISFSSAVILDRRDKGNNDDTPPTRGKKSTGFLLFIMLISGVCVALNNKLNLYLAGIIPSAIFFPIVNGGGLVLTTLSALVFFRERLTAKQWVGVILGTASVVLVCNPFG